MLCCVPAFSNCQLTKQSTTFLKNDCRLCIHGTTCTVRDFGAEMSQSQFCQSEIKYIHLGSFKVKRPGQTMRAPGGWSSQISRQSIFECNKFVSHMHRPTLSHRKYYWYSFLLEAESTPGPQCGPKDYVNEKFEWHHRESNPRPSGL
jgi:hypothetical protein